MSLEQNEPQSVKTSAPGRRRRIAIWVVLLLGLPLVLFVWGWHGCVSEQDGSKPPAPDAPEARQWEPETEQFPQAEAPGYEWPEGWSLPLEIVIDDIPEIPKQIQGPSPRIEDGGTSGDPSSAVDD